ncbi:hypothetical protein [Xenorhabdus szentirmaii]|uniref:Uncharacterized protein n=1 Tax=Xenorhabdus szentirmaii DSM 16338 TaxID=1427518 RepID=W1ITD5_9GAMM|nr:hypothetical protein [Xenorhabdus szentirmaii]PHM30608.1 hypothetical protein Xsze_04199 [Xenorhabdus szentirmaii DSM 16338]CDL81088.1 hypothetical protein XSR1_100130 [Xenorhabdus szentirmaii DSM 16338]
MDNSTFIEKIKALDGFNGVETDEQPDIISTGIETMEREFERLTSETFFYSPDKVCLEIQHIRLRDSDSLFDLVYMIDFIKKSAKLKVRTPLTYMIGFCDNMLVAVTSDFDSKPPLKVFDSFTREYRKQSDEEFIGMPMAEFHAVLHENKLPENSGFASLELLFNNKVSATMPDYHTVKGESGDVLRHIKDHQGVQIMTQLNSGLDLIQLANSFADNIINRSARLTSQAVAEMGMMKEQAISYGLKAASSSIADIQLRGSKLAGMAGMF